jgi:hypothetical protein
MPIKPIYRSFLCHALRNKVVIVALSAFAAHIASIQAVPLYHSRIQADPSVDTGRVITYLYPSDSPTSQTCQVRAAGRDVFVYHTSAGDFAAFAFEGAIEMEIATPAPVKDVRVTPARLQIAPEIDGNKIRFQLGHPAHLLIEIDGLEQLFLYADLPDTNPPPPEAPGVHYYRAGQVYDAGEIRLRDRETLYIEGGAVVRGCIRATSAEGVRIAGYGILDGGIYKLGDRRRRSILLEGCRNSRVEDIIIIEPSAWMVVLGACDHVTVRNIKELGEPGGSDGIDIVGSRHIRVENCMCRSGDDCVAIKSLDLRPHDRDATMDYAMDVQDIEITGCVFLSNRGGQAMEIGHELRTALVSDIRFRDIDVLGVHQFGAPFGIHNADRATVSNVTYENIRVEHHYDKLVDFRIIKSRWSQDIERGQIRDVTLRNIDVVVSIYNPGYTCSLIGGYDAQHTIEHVRFENFRIAGKPATSPDDLDLYCKHAEGIVFK